MILRTRIQPWMGGCPGGSAPLLSFHAESRSDPGAHGVLLKLHFGLHIKHTATIPTAAMRTDWSEAGRPARSVAGDELHPTLPVSAGIQVQRLVLGSNTAEYPGILLKSTLLPYLNSPRVCTQLVPC